MGAEGKSQSKSLAATEWWSDPSTTAAAWRLAELGCWDWDRPNDEMRWSDEMYQIYATDLDQFAGTYQAFLALIHPDDREHVEKAITIAIQTAQPYHVYHRLSQEQNDVRIIHVRGEPATDEQDHVIRLVGTAQDVTALRRSEAELTMQAQQFATLTNLGQLITGTLDLTVIFRQMIEQVSLLIPLDHVFLFLRQERQLTLAATNDPQIDVDAFQLPIDDLIRQFDQQPRAIWRYGTDVANHLPTDITTLVTYQPRAVLHVPIIMQEELIGILLVLAKDVNAFSNETLQLIEAAAGWIAIAVANARKHQALQERLCELETIIRISQLITETVELDKVLMLIVESAKEMVCRADWSVIHLYREEMESLEAVMASGLEAPLAQYTVKIGEGIAGAVFQSGAPVNVTDLLEDERSLPFDRELKSRSLLVVPMKNRQTLIGTLTVQCCEPGTYGEADERLLTALGLQACIAIQNARVFTELDYGHQQLKRLSQKFVTVQEEERQRLARELHDDAGQMLTALRIGLGLVREDLTEDGTYLDMLDVKERITEAIDLTDRVVDIIRQITYSLRPPSLTTSGLQVALSGLCQKFAAQTNIAVTYESDDLPLLADNTGIILYRIVQEALANTAQHAEAQTVTVTLVRTATELTLSIVDDGHGFTIDKGHYWYIPQAEESPQHRAIDRDDDGNSDGDVQAAGTGLIGIVELCELLDGEVHIQSAPGEGTNITVIVPYHSISVEE